MTSNSLLPIYALDQARVSILKRRPPDETEAPPVIAERLRELFGETLSPEEAVRRILRTVRETGDAALRDWTRRIDGVEVEALAVPEADIRAVLEQAPLEVVEALQFAAQRIEGFHRRQMQQLGGWWGEDGLGQLLNPLERIGVYVPGGTAPLPSSLLMSALPAMVAGVDEIIVCTPPSRQDGSVPPVILAAAAVCSVTRVYRIGGAQAIGALAYGTQSIPRVDKIVGPGNLFVTLAKRQVFGVVGIDGLPGPTETLIIADETADPALVAADLLAQAEHDVLASAILLTPSRSLAEQAQQAVARQAERLSRAEIIAQSLAGQGGVVLVDDLRQAFEVANAYAAEHLCLHLDDASRWVGEVKNAGGVFVGDNSFEVLGDYVAGPSHVMPTGGTARFASPLSVLDFLKITSLVSLDKETTTSLSKAAAILARAEALTAHAAAAQARLQEK